jgi:hypothetical protein
MLNGLHYNFHRYYAPATDGIKKGSDRFEGWDKPVHLYINNPLANFDPDGNLVISVPVAIALAMGLLGV